MEGIRTLSLWILMVIAIVWLIDVDALVVRDREEVCFKQYQVVEHFVIKGKLYCLVDGKYLLAEDEE